MVGYFYHLNYLHDDNAAAAPAVIEVQDSPAPPKKRPRKTGTTTTTTKRTRASTVAPTQAAQPPSSKVHLIEHAKAFAMATKYQIDALQNLAAQKFRAEVEQHWDHEDLAHAIHVIYTSTADEVTQLRKITVQALNAHRGQLLEKPEIATLLRSITGLACDLLMRDHDTSTGHHIPKKADAPDDVVCYDRIRHRLNQHAHEELCKSCHRYFEVCTSFSGDPAFLGSPLKVWKCSLCGVLDAY